MNRTGVSYLSFFSFLFLGQLLFFPLLLRGQQAIDDEISFAAEAKIEGVLGERLAVAYEHNILAQDVDRLIAVFKPENRTETRMWQSEFWGKWFTSAVLAYRYHPTSELKEVLDDAVHGLMATQTPDGYIGNYAKEHLLEQWDIWGRKYCMLGLLDYYDLTGEKTSLEAASKLADNLIDDLEGKDGIIVTKGNYRGMAASSVLEPICLLYARTKQKKYLDFAEEIVSQWESPEGPQLLSKSKIPVAKRFPKPESWYSWEQGQKAYEMMSCYEGLLELYRITGKEAYKIAVEDTWQNIRDTEINIAGSGASAEMWFGGKALQAFPVHHYQETCVTVTWIKLSAQLLRLTGESKYADAIEQAYYNALLGAVHKDGAQWAKYTPLTGQRLPGSEQCGMGLNCCEASGPRGLFLFPRLVATAQRDGLQINYYADGEYVVNTPKKQLVTIHQNTAYPEDGLVNIVVNPEKEEEFAINLRIPSWSTQSALKVNGETIRDWKPGAYVSVRRKWKKGDQIELQLDMRGRVVKLGDVLQYTAILRGPIVLTRDTRLGTVPVGISLDPKMIEGNHIELEPFTDNKAGFWMLYHASFIPESYREKGADPLSIILCDYASAGYGDETNPFFQTWIPQVVDPRSSNENY
ncbi:glycoside hydrolase family 127 protein [Olivibacter sp. SDN3]|uniref:glycoside hydrolase family 127 protein n=1 Tax=Olivibacter sp. SDN3 TaxID=2764720 RepID=UPI001651A4A8|nr:beta-L-arabinofuranosidase domain-containing protein [Olivibacter sp. SDN3]QNL50447.1 glycoside hydrolase family 127 protein [Olivibacter sp. SDN3]